MKNNIELQTDVQNAIQWEPLLHAAEIGVTVKDGIVSLTGTVDNYAKKLEAENAAKKVKGVKALIENIEVKFPNSWIKTDLEIAEEVLSALEANWSVAKDKVTALVADGWVTLEGTLPWNFQRENAEICVQHLAGITGVSNNIKIKSDISDTVEQKDVKRALNRSTIDDKDIVVSVNHNKVTLSGTANSFYQKDEAERIAYKTPGIWHVDNELGVDYEYEHSQHFND